MKIELKGLAGFLKEANKSTYANKDAPKSQSLRSKSEDYHFENGDLIYHDTYFGSRDFIGEEIVYKEGQPVWGMNYYGFILESGIPAKDVYSILRSALMQDDEGIAPVRGPRIFKQGNSQYQNRIDGDLNNFSGVEEIFLDGEVVYRCLYHGGLIE